MFGRRWVAYRSKNLYPIFAQTLTYYSFASLIIEFQVANELSRTVAKGKARVADLCCGVGFSTRALTKAFPDAESIIGIDTSPEMVAMANFISGIFKFFMTFFKSTTSAMRISPLAFSPANAEDTKLPGHSFDLVTIMFAFHEVPKAGRTKILREARRLLHPGGTLAVVDIATDFKPSVSMLSGEPYVTEYQKNIHRQLSQVKGFMHREFTTLIPGHVGMWTLKRSWA